MSSLAGRQPNQTYGNLLQVDNSNNGVDATYRDVQDGGGTSSGLQLSSGGAKIPSSKELKIVGTLDFASASSVTGVLGQSNGALGVTTAASARTVLGGGTVGISVFQAVAAASGRTALGGGTVGQSVFVSVAAASGRTALGGGAVGSPLFTVGTEASGRTVLALGTAAVANTGVSNGNVPAMDGTGYPAANGSQITNLNAANLASGTVPAARISFAAQSDQETATSTTLPVTPGVQQFHPSALKAWAEWNGNGTVASLASYNVSGITDNGTGLYTPAWDTDFSSANYGITGICRPNGVSNAGIMLNNGGTLTAGAAQVNTQTFGGTDHDASRVSVMAAGDQT